MAFTTTVEIGKKKLDLPELSFAAVERAWPYIEIATSALDPITGCSASLRILSAMIIEDEDYKAEEQLNLGPEVIRGMSIDEQWEYLTRELKIALKANQMGQLALAIIKVLTDANLIGEEEKPGEELAGQEAIPSPETAPASSPSLLPQDAKEEAGTA